MDEEEDEDDEEEEEEDVEEGNKNKNSEGGRNIKGLLNSIKDFKVNPVQN